MKRSTIVRSTVLTLSIFLFCNFIINGEKGMRFYMSLMRETHESRVKLASLESKVLSLKNQIKEWNSPFLAEKVAREELLLGMSGETVYIIK